MEFRNDKWLVEQADKQLVPLHADHAPDPAWRRRVVGGFWKLCLCSSSTISKCKLPLPAAEELLGDHQAPATSVDAAAVSATLDRLLYHGHVLKYGPRWAHQDRLASTGGGRVEETARRYRIADANALSSLGDGRWMRSYAL